MPQSKVLLLVSSSSRGSSEVVTYCRYTGLPFRVHVQSIFKGPKKKRVLVHYVQIRNLTWDTTRLEWPDNVQFMQYSTKLGRKLLRKRHPLLQLAAKKWGQMLLANFRFWWTNIWDHERQRKEAGLIWQVQHKAVAVKVWRGTINNHIDTSCLMCGFGQDEMVLHRFWDCTSSQQVWYSITPLLKHFANPYSSTAWDLPNWKQAIFTKHPPHKYHKVSRYQTLLKGIALWTIWLARNDINFNNIRWNHKKVKQIFGKALAIMAGALGSKLRRRFTGTPFPKRMLYLDLILCGQGRPSVLVRI